MSVLLFYWFCATVLQLLKYRACQISLISLDFIEILLFLIRFEPLRGPLIRKQTVFILLLQLYNGDMTLQNNFDTILTCKRALTFFSNNFSIFAPPPLRR